MFVHSDHDFIHGCVTQTTRERLSHANSGLRKIGMAHLLCGHQSSIGAGVAYGVLTSFYGFYAESDDSLTQPTHPGHACAVYAPLMAVFLASLKFKGGVSSAELVAAAAYVVGSSVGIFFVLNGDAPLASALVLAAALGGFAAATTAVTHPRVRALCLNAAVVNACAYASYAFDDFSIFPYVLIAACYAAQLSVKLKAPGLVDARDDVDREASFYFLGKPWRP